MILLYYTLNVELYSITIHFSRTAFSLALFRHAAGPRRALKRRATSALGEMSALRSV